MFENVGEKLKKFAVFCFVFNVIAAVVLLIVGFSNIDWGGWWYILGAVVLVFISLFESWLLYAFGQITDDVNKMANSVHKIENKTHKEQRPAEDEIPEI